MTGMSESEGTFHYAAREVVGVFSDAQVLGEAVERLGLAGVDRTAISVLAVSAERSGRMKAFSDSADPIAAGDTLKRAAFVSQDFRAEGQVMAIDAPFQIDGFAGAWAVPAAGGALVTVVAAAVVGRGIRAGLGVVLFRAVARYHAPDVYNKLVRGGFALWVGAPGDKSERCATQVLERCGATAIHTDTVFQIWGVADSPLHGVQPDPVWSLIQPNRRPQAV